MPNDLGRKTKAIYHKLIEILSLLQTIPNHPISLWKEVSLRFIIHLIIQN